MFNWNVEDMNLMNEECKTYIGREKIYNCEATTSREDKISFVDKMQNGKLSYILSLIEKFNQDKEKMPKDSFGNVKTVSLIAWVKRNDKKYTRPVIDDWYRYGTYYILGMERNIKYNHKGTYDTYTDLVDEAFHRQLKNCESEEHEYFSTHDEYSVLKSQVREKCREYGTSFGVNLGFCSDGRVYVAGQNKKERELTIEELKELLGKYEQLDKMIEKLTADTHIVF